MNPLRLIKTNISVKFTNIFLELTEVILGNPNMKKTSIGFEDLGYALVM